MKRDISPPGRRVRPGNTRLLTASYLPVAGFRLADGRFTSLRTVAEDDVSTYRGPDVAAALLSLPVDRLRDDATPARTAALRQLVRDGHVPAGVGEHFLGLGGVTDTVWEVLRPLLHATGGTPPETRACWDVTLVNVSGHRFDLPVQYDAGEHQHPSRPPFSGLEEILTALSARGWQLGWGRHMPWDAGRPEPASRKASDGTSVDEVPSPIQVELFRRRIRRSERPRSEL